VAIDDHRLDRMTLLHLGDRLKEEGQLPFVERARFVGLGRHLGAQNAFEGRCGVGPFNEAHDSGDHRELHILNVHGDVHPGSKTGTSHRAWQCSSPANSALTKGS
jgi:hypothetical protein